MTALASQRRSREARAGALRIVRRARDALFHAREKGAPSGLDAPPSGIVQRAEADGADLIVVGSRGLGRLRRALVGSTSRHVARFAKASVLVVKEP
jgi:nucleotide-binding universal stress UspA family protein